MKNFIEYLSEYSGYSIDELVDRDTEPLLQPMDCIAAFRAFHIDVGCGADHTVEYAKEFSKFAKNKRN